ncbi:MAG: DUF1501 domain-containing protein [Oxalicibacterium faecigallinarum]|uniref:DUF1501 domain-containing protein n=1 Tax=Oxalicibacterium faecigallinarum TaxID=573741 RepID=UPI002808AF3E|nr:DUF1501 domain-containing protein [Oxalicibacterium faecigallinarum]MDQ7970594.1 DUF1501 domain-containing protein [Oxalicibacterium faecigallinarum]
MQRRQFLTSSMALASGLVIPLGKNAWAATSNNATDRKLIVIMLRGAVDGLNVVTPYGDANYRQLRPTIGLAPPGQEDGAIDLDGYFGLHPTLHALQPLWEQKKLAFIHASGSPDSSRSHFDAQAYLESGTPGIKRTQDGWMNRLLAALPAESSPIRAISIGPTMPAILSGRALATNIGNTKASNNSPIDRPQVGDAFAQMYRNNEKFSKTYQDARSARKEIASAAMSPTMTQEMINANGGAPLPNGFPKDAAHLATLMRNDPRIQMAFIALGGWDTHANQGAGKGQLANRLAPLGQGLATLAEQLGPLFDDTTIVVMSEFGRTARENGNRGTDHGHGNVMWLLGGRVHGGKVHGDWQGLSSDKLNEGRDLPVTTDFRSVLAQMAERHLRLNDNQLTMVFPSGPGTSTLSLYV